MEPTGTNPEWLIKRREERGIKAMPEFSRGPQELDERLLLADVAFNKHSVNDGHHVSPSDNGMIQVGTDGIQVVLAQGIDEEAFRRTLTAATRATIGLDLSQPLPGDWEWCEEFYDAWVQNPMNFNITDFKCSEHVQHRRTADRMDAPQYMGKVPYPDWEEMLKGGLQTALETQVIVFAVSGVSRTCTHQLVRSRKAAFHQQSQRAGYMGDMPECRMPESIWRNPRARGEFLRATMASWRAYQVACEEDISYQDARFILPEGTTNFIMLEYPVREFLNVYAYRACSMFQWEIVQVMRQCKDVLVAQHPWIEPYVKISCEKPQRCTFQGWESPEGQCDLPWAKDELRTFKPEFHQIGRRTGKESV
jgi:flavin-dependent thymidylate synthase